MSERKQMKGRRNPTTGVQRQPRKYWMKDITHGGMQKHIQVQKGSYRQN